MLQGAWIPITYIKHFRTRASMSGIILKTVRFSYAFHNSDSRNLRVKRVLLYNVIFKFSGKYGYYQYGRWMAKTAEQSKYFKIKLPKALYKIRMKSPCWKYLIHGPVLIHLKWCLSKVLFEISLRYFWKTINYLMTEFLNSKTVLILNIKRPNQTEMRHKCKILRNRTWCSM